MLLMSCYYTHNISSAYMPITPPQPLACISPDDTWPFILMIRPASGQSLNFSRKRMLSQPSVTLHSKQHQICLSHAHCKSKAGYMAAVIQPTKHSPHYSPPPSSLERRIYYVLQHYNIFIVHFFFLSNNYYNS